MNKLALLLDIAARRQVWMKFGPTPSRSLLNCVRRRFSTDIDKVDLHVKTEPHSWSYEFDADKIKGISYSPTSGNYVIIYTCGVCEARQSRSFTKHAYHHGVVIVRCEGCDNLHLIADNLKFFEDNSVNVEDLVRRQNGEVVKVQATGALKEFMHDKLKKREESNINNEEGITKQE